MDIMTFIFLFSRITKYLLRLTLIIVSPSSSLPFGNANRKALVPMQICSLWYYAQIVVSKKIYTPYLFKTYSKLLIQNISNYVPVSDDYRIMERYILVLIWIQTWWIYDLTPLYTHISINLLHILTFSGSNFLKHFSVFSYHIILSWTISSLIVFKTIFELAMKKGKLYRVVNLPSFVIDPISLFRYRYVCTIARQGKMISQCF